MPASSELTSVIDTQLLRQLGERLKRARLKQGLTTTQMAKRAGISRMTLSAVEAGSPTPTMGSYLRVMGALQVSKDLVLVASETMEAPRSGEEPASPEERQVSVSNARHELQDLQSLMLHQEAVNLLRKQPELVQRALETLERWRASGASHSRPLWDEWAVILHRRGWRRALSHTKRAKELRQASPLPTILPPEVRHRVLQDVQRLKNGVELGVVPTVGGGVRRGT